MIDAKPFTISKRLVWQAWQKVKANKGAAGIDGQSLADFEVNLSGNLYKLWNRMSSGSYFPPPVMRVDIDKKDGGTRPLGVPTVADCIAQTVVKMIIEPVDQSLCAGLDQLLWKILSIGVEEGSGLCGRNTGSLGYGQIQEIEGSKMASFPLSGQGCQKGSDVNGTLALWLCVCGWIRRAV